MTITRAVRFIQAALVNGGLGLVLGPGGRLLRVLRFTIERGKIVQVEVVADPARLREFDFAVL